MPECVCRCQFRYKYIWDCVVGASKRYCLRYVRFVPNAYNRRRIHMIELCVIVCTSLYDDVWLLQILSVDVAVDIVEVVVHIKQTIFYGLSVRFSFAHTSHCHWISWNFVDDEFAYTQARPYTMVVDRSNNYYILTFTLILIRTLCVRVVILCNVCRGFGISANS